MNRVMRKDESCDVRIPVNSIHGGPQCPLIYIECDREQNRWMIYLRLLILIVYCLENTLNCLQHVLPWLMLSHVQLSAWKYILHDEAFFIILFCRRSLFDLHSVARIHDGNRKERQKFIFSNENNFEKCFIYQVILILSGSSKTRLYSFIFLSISHVHFGLAFQFYCILYEAKVTF